MLETPKNLSTIDCSVKDSCSIVIILNIALSLHIALGVATSSQGHSVRSITRSVSVQWTISRKPRGYDFTCIQYVGSSETIRETF